MAEPTSHPRDVVAGDRGEVRRRTTPAAVLAKAVGIAALSGLAAAERYRAGAHAPGAQPAVGRSVRGAAVLGAARRLV